MSEMVHVNDLREGDVIVLSAGSICTVLTIEGDEIHLVMGAGSSTGHEEWFRKAELSSVWSTDQKILVLYREQFVPVT